MNKKNIVAFFDIDGTLYRDSLLIEHFKKLVKYEMIDYSLWYNDIKRFYEDWDKRQGNFDNYLQEICKIYEKSLLGINEKYVDVTSEQMIKLKADRVYKYTRNRIKWHLEQGHLVIFISGSPDFLVKKMAEKYNASDYSGTQYLFENGKFNGKIIPMWDNKSKNDKVNEYVDKYNINLKESYAYGDTNGDITMLKKVGYPIAINPSKELLINIINDNTLKIKTKVIVERKDVVYDLYPENISANIYK